MSRKALKCAAAEHLPQRRARAYPSAKELYIRARYILKYISELLYRAKKSHPSQCLGRGGFTHPFFPSLTPPQNTGGAECAYFPCGSTGLYRKVLLYLTPTDSGLMPMTLVFGGGLETCAHLESNEKSRKTQHVFSSLTAPK